MSVNQQLAVKGRLMLWDNALLQCSMFLSVFHRSQQEIDSGGPKSRHSNWLEGLKEFSKQQPDYVPNDIQSKHHREYSLKFPEAFPSFFDCYQIKNACGISAVVLFCQIFNSGYGVSEEVARNSKAFRADHLDKILLLIFSDETELEVFEGFRDSCIAARDNMIAHADGEAFDLEHGSPISKVKLVVSSIQDIDFHYMREITPKLRHAVEKYSETLSE